MSTEEEVIDPREIEEAVAEFYKTASPVSPEELKAKKLNEQTLLKSFQKDRSPDTFTPLYQSFKPLIFKAASKNMIRSNIPKSAHMAFAAQNFLSAVDNFDPKKASLASHVYNTVLQKGKRLNYKYQNIGYIPEERTSKYGNYMRALSYLREELGREPSSIELADELRWPVRRIELLRKEDKRDLVLDEFRSGGEPVFHSDKAKQVFSDMSYDLPPKHALVLEYAVGLNGRPSLTKAGGGADVHAIMKATKLPMSEVRNAFRAISTKYRQYKGNSLIEETEPNEEVSEE